VYPQPDSLASYWPSGLYDAGMQLDRSRTALRQAAQAIAELRAARNNSEQFRDKFPLVMAAVQRVGSIIDHETEGHRTPQFGNWWTRTQDNPLFVFMRDVRNAEFKRADRRQRATHYGRAELHIRSSFSARGEVRDEEGRVKEGGRLSEPPSPSPEPPSPKPQTTTTESTDWYFWGGGQYDGQEVFTLLDRYIAWLRDDILPMAERLTK
jgi:hypothetical protein